MYHDSAGRNIACKHGKTDFVKYIATAKLQFLFLIEQIFLPIKLKLLSDN